jgi:hypothetical protein
MLPTPSRRRAATSEESTPVAAPVELASLLASFTLRPEAERSFTEHHKVSADVARNEVRLLLELGLESGRWTRLKSGRLRVIVEQYSIELDVDRLEVTWYVTRHYERTPSQVFGGVRSRFGGSTGARRQPGTPRPLDVVRRDFNTDEVAVLSGVVKRFAKTSGLNPKSPAVERRLRAELKDAADHGAWGPGRNNTAFVVNGADRSFVIAADDGTVIAMYMRDGVSESGPPD